MTVLGLAKQELVIASVVTLVGAILGFAHRWVFKDNAQFSIGMTIGSAVMLFMGAALACHGWWLMYVAKKNKPKPEMFPADLLSSLLGGLPPGMFPGRQGIMTIRLPSKK